MGDSRVAPNDKPAWDIAFTKYVHVWIWSILLGATTSTGYLFLSYRPIGKWGALGAALIAILAFGALSVLAALYLLARFLLGYLLPLFFADADVSNTDKMQAGLRLSQSLRFLILAILARFIMTAAELLLSTRDF
jgi:hypothetical protein